MYPGGLGRAHLEDQSAAGEELHGAHEDGDIANAGVEIAGGVEAGPDEGHVCARVQGGSIRVSGTATGEVWGWQ